jgi:hypothetical protein
MAETTSGFSAPRLGSARVNARAAEMIAVLRSHSSAKKTVHRDLFTAGYVIVVRQK